MIYDQNGLQLSEVAETMNAYRLTAVDKTVKKFVAYARAARSSNDEWSMYDLGFFKDPRDAAYAAQEFELLYTKEQIRQMVIDKVFYETARDYRETLEIPEWQYPAEGLDMDDILGGSYKMNYVNNAREALVEALGVMNKKVPVLAIAKLMMNEVEKLVKNGTTYRNAAHKIVGELNA